MSTHQMYPLPVGKQTVMAVDAFGRVYIPLRSLMTFTLDATWSAARAAAVTRMETRWGVKTLAVAAASGRIGIQPCLRAARLTAFLWTLRPGKPETQQKLAMLQDDWEAALLNHLKANAAELGNVPAGAVAALIENARRPLLQELEVVRGDLAKAGFRTGPDLTMRDAALRRWGNQKNKTLTTDDFLAMAEMGKEGNSPSEIAKAAGCSRTAVSLFLHGKLPTKAAVEAVEILKNRGWEPRVAL